MAIKDPYVPPSFGVRNLAIERRMAGKPPASIEDQVEEAAAAKPSVKMAKAPENKGRAPAKRKAPATKRTAK